MRIVSSTICSLCLYSCGLQCYNNNNNNINNNNNKNNKNKKNLTSSFFLVSGDISASGVFVESNIN